MREQRSDPVVVAEPDLVTRNRVVLVDDRHTAELEQPDQGLARMQVLTPVHEIVRHEQRLAGDETVPTELGRVDLHELRLARRSKRLQCGHVGGSARKAECRDSGRHRTRGDDEHLVTGSAQRGRLVAQACNRSAVDDPALVGERRRSDLGYDAHYSSGT